MVVYRETKNYIWSTDDKLGTGATAIVYKGFNKCTGEPAAIKVFYKRHEPREIRVLKKIDHNNIVKLLDIEETSNGDKVLIMELCTGNSLAKVLNDPENDYGLNDTEFLLVLRNLYDGIKYLRQNNLIHRDLKPDNIMRCVLDDGTHIYKLTDFGAARELEEGEQFFSIHGTEEYLRPDMYERAFLTRKPKTFDDTIDLWSLGVTLYHAATGKLPFKPYGGRHNRDKTAMHKITTEKESGVISGTQSQPNGRVHYCKELPKNCLMSDNLKEVITPLLAGLMEADVNKSWNFNQFFGEVEKILSRRDVHIFHMNSIRLFTVYVHPSETYEVFQGMIMKTIGVDIQNQLILFKNRKLDVHNMADIPKTSETSPLFLLDKTSNAVTKMVNKSVPVSDLPSQGSNNSDVCYCRIVCKVGYQFHREINKSSLYNKLICEGVDIFIKYLQSEFGVISTKFKHIYEMAQTLQMTATLLRSKQLKNASELLTPIVNDRMSSLQDSPSALAIEWDKLNENIDQDQMISHKATARNYVKSLSNLLEEFEKSDQLRILSQFDQNLRNLEKAKLKNLSDKFKILLNAVYIDSLKVTQNFSRWFPTALNLNNEITTLNGQLDEYEEKVSKYQEELKLASNEKSLGRECENLKNTLEKYKDKGDYAKLIDDNCILFECLSKKQEEMALMLFDSYINFNGCL